MSEYPVGVVGGGILGLAIARRLTQQGESVVLFEKEDRLALHQSGHNSGVVHAGIYYSRGSLKAELCTIGRGMLREFCADHQIPYLEVGKLVVAVDETELGRLDALEERASANNVPGLRRIHVDAIREVEPHAAGLAALHSPQTAITDFAAVSHALAEEITGAGGEILLSTKVTGIRRSSGYIEVATDDGHHRVGKLVICAGLQSDRVAEPADGQSSPRIVPFRGEYMTVSSDKQDLVRGMIYPVPDPRYPFLGVHFHRMVSGELEVGPNAVLGLNREGYRRSQIHLGDIWSYLTWPGFWRMVGGHWRAGIAEFKGSVSIRGYMKRASRYVPEIGYRDVVRGRAGIRAQALDRDGTLVDDFRIYANEGVYSIRNAPSPAATSSLAIADHVVEMMYPTR